MIEVVPAIIPDNFIHLQDEIEKVASFVSRVQIDIMDGAFAPTKSWPYKDKGDISFEKLVKGEENLPHADKLIHELDMMIEKPEEHIDAWMNAGIKSFIIHIESTTELASIITKTKERYVEIGLALKPSTSIEELEPWIEQINFVQFMGNDKIGYHGVSLDSFVLPSIEGLRKAHPELIIGIDIGVTEETAPILVNQGVTKLVSGSAIFNSENIEETIEKFKALEKEPEEEGE